MAETITKTRVKSTTAIAKPKDYKVIILNDDATPIEFVIALLMTVFRHDEDTAFKITMNVHENGKGTAGIYSYQIAEQKEREGTTMARNNGYPLVLKTEPL